MWYTSTYPSPVGEIRMAADQAGLTGLWFAGQKGLARGPRGESRRDDLPVFALARRWLDLYFSGREPGFTPPVHLSGTDFQRQVWDILQTIPYGATATYGDVARQVARRRGLVHMSAQAVGGAVGRNPVSIIVPCHRVVGVGGSLTGYAGGLARKRFLLELEGGIPADR